MRAPALSPDMDSKQLALLCRDLADNKKAEDLLVLDVNSISSITDYFVIVSGTSEPHLRAIAHEITDTLRDDHGIRPRAEDGVLQTVHCHGKVRPQRRFAWRAWPRCRASGWS